MQKNKDFTCNIIKSGYLEGPIAASDSIMVNYFTLPFNLADSRMHGAVMRIMKWTYPHPLVRIDLTKVTE
jgi:hypothetical protein